MNGSGYVDFLNSCTARYVGPINDTAIERAIDAATDRVLTLNLEILSNREDEADMLSMRGFVKSGTETVGTQVYALWRLRIRDAGDGQAPGVPYAK
jgi:hypothetical protein